MQAVNLTERIVAQVGIGSRSLILRSSSDIYELLGVVCVRLQCEAVEVDLTHQHFTESVVWLPRQRVGLVPIFQDEAISALKLLPADYSGFLGFGSFFRLIPFIHIFNLVLPCPIKALNILKGFLDNIR